MAEMQTEKKKTKHYQVFAFAKATDLMILAMMEGEE